jgi:hypothetical protein
MLPCGTKLFVHVYESKTLKKVVEIKVLRPCLIFFEYAKWQHDIDHYKLVISCMIFVVAYVMRSTNEKFNQPSYIFYQLSM